MSENVITHEGQLIVGTMPPIPCYVLSDGTRVLSGRAMQEVLKIRDKPEDGKKKSGYILPTFFSSKALKPFVYSKLEVAKLEPLICHKGNQKIHGYEATILVDLCDAILEARKRGKKLTERQELVADQCEILVRAFAKVGIIALVDEATGYQYDREKDALQDYLKEVISTEILKWQEAFHLSFYKQIFKIWGIPFTEKNIKRKPQFIGHITNRYIYGNMPQGTFVLGRLKEQTPKSKGGGYKYRLHQSLTPEKGKELLKKVIYTIEGFAAVARDKREFDRMVNEMYGQKQIPFPDLEEFEDMKDKKALPISFGSAMNKIANAGKPKK